MKLRRLLQDFVVEELNEFHILESGEFKLYSLQKQGLETFYIIHYLSRTNDIPRNAIGIAGLKDKHAITKQYFTIPREYEIKTLKENNYEIIFFGYLDAELHRGDLLGNRFQITARDITTGQLEGIYKRASDITEIGVPNYYDSQRFGSVIKGVFIRKLVEENRYEEALKAYLTLYKRSEHKESKKDKREIFSHWDDLSTVKVTNNTLKAVINEYLATKDWKKAYAKIPSHLRELYKHAYESYQWNENVKEILSTNVTSVYSITSAAGKLLFYKKLSKEEKQQLPDTIGERKLLIFPKNFVISRPLIDELHANRYKITVSFELPKGNYATIVTKRLFNN